MKFLKVLSVALLCGTMLLGTACSSMTNTGKGALIGGGGGGQKFYATAGGKNPDGVQAAIDRAVEMIMEKLN